MIFFSDAELDAFLLEDVYRGDLTTRMMGIGNVPARMTFKRKNAGRVAGVAVAAQVLRKLGLEPEVLVEDGVDVESGTLLIEVTGRAELLHQGWKVAQVIMEWSCGVAQYMADMVNNAVKVNPDAVVACTRKCVPGSRKLATAALIAGGGHIHRAGASETVLVFANHSRLLDEEQGLSQLASLGKKLPENRVTIEADDLEHLAKILEIGPDIIQLDKFSLQDVETAKSMLAESGKPLVLSLAGGVNRDNISRFAATGLNLFITSAPYYAGPEDIKVVINKL
ncbi:ModD protein [Vibrio sp. JC009]|uniref:ModD protein n=1 Tax=Vibrio sp. JC009 TaxID=2912314 RepID=UPI0023B0816C|nr:ModD protein [Vibrio sp. JC009]WED23825.1 ModD protein [Vibrio sp. JC009]